ncbi:glycosyltransferase [Bacillus paralicheniformis]|nr:glycosyltransferase family 2 protein [Bacillus paralicheniformis]MPQ26481.1 glycosyltransferase [Bacillus paralicheniformis]
MEKVDGEMENTMVRVTVIIPTKDREHDLKRCLQGLLKNDVTLIEEIVIIDDNSQKPLKIKEFDLPLKIIRNSKSIGAAACRNKAVNSVKSKIIAFLDDDAIPTPDWITTVVYILEKKRCGITGRVLRFDRGIVSKARQERYNIRYKNLRRGDKVNFFSGGNSAIWTDIFEEVNGFSCLSSGGDNEIVRDLDAIGYDVCFIPELVILHRNSKGVKQAIMEAFKSGREKSDKIHLKTFVKEIVKFRTLYQGSLIVSLFNWCLNVIH